VPEFWSGIRAKAAAEVQTVGLFAMASTPTGLARAEADHKEEL